MKIHGIKVPEGIPSGSLFADLRLGIQYGISRVDLGDVGGKVVVQIQISLPFKSNPRRPAAMIRSHVKSLGEIGIPKDFRIKSLQIGRTYLADGDALIGAELEWDL